MDCTLVQARVPEVLREGAARIVNEVSETHEQAELANRTNRQIIEGYVADSSSFAELHDLAGRRSRFGLKSIITTAILRRNSNRCFTALKVVK